MLNGNIGVIKSMLAELTDDTNMARGFSLIPVIWAIGGTIGFGAFVSFLLLCLKPFFLRPLMGGVLSRPQDRWPNAFSHPFWGEFPYFLPCLGTAAYATLSFILTAFFLKEVSRYRLEKCLLLCSLQVIQTVDCKSSTKHDPRTFESMDETPMEEEKPQSLRSLLTRPVVISVANYAVIGLLEMMAAVLIPLVWSTPLEYGGLGMTPASIGVWMAGYGLLNGIFQFVGFPRIVERFGPRRVFLVSISSFFPMYLMLFFENLALRYATGGATITVLLIILQLSSIAISDMGFSKSFSTSISHRIADSNANL